MAAAPSQRAARAGCAGTCSPPVVPRGTPGVVVPRRNPQAIGCWAPCPRPRAAGSTAHWLPGASAARSVTRGRRAAGAERGVAERRRRAEMPEATRCSGSSGAESGSDCSMDTEAGPESGRRRHKVPGKGSGYGLAAPARWGWRPASLASDGGRPHRRWRGPGSVCAAWPRGGPGRAATCAIRPGRGLAACRGGPAGRAGPAGAGREPGKRFPRHPERGRAPKTEARLSRGR